MLVRKRNRWGYLIHEPNLSPPRLRSASTDVTESPEPLQCLLVRFNDCLRQPIEL